jgi:hypothetical protein
LELVVLGHHCGGNGALIYQLDFSPATSIVISFWSDREFFVEELGEVGVIHPTGNLLLLTYKSN